MVVDVTPYIKEVNGEVALRGSRKEEKGKTINLRDELGTRITLYTRLESNGYSVNNVIVSTPRIDITGDLSLYETGHNSIDNSIVKVVVSGSSTDIWDETLGGISLDSESVEELRDSVSKNDNVWMRFRVSTDTKQVSPSKVEELRVPVNELFEDMLEIPQVERF